MSAPVVGYDPAPVVSYDPVLHKVGVRWDKACTAPSAMEVLAMVVTTFWPVRVCVSDLQHVSETWSIQ